MQIFIKKIIDPRLITILLFLIAIAACYHTVGKMTSSHDKSSRNNFIVGVFLVPNQWIIDMETDLSEIKKIANTIFVTAGRYEQYQDKYLKAVLDASLNRGLQVVLIYNQIHDGNTTLNSVVERYGSHPAVIGFYVKGELGSEGMSTQYWIDRLTKAKNIIRKHSTKPIMVDIIPWELLREGNPYFRYRFPATSNESIDKYIQSRLIDWLIISLGNNVTGILPKVMSKWGDKIKILVRIHGSYRGDTFSPKLGPELSDLNSSAMYACAIKTGGIHYYAWNHQNFRILNKDGSSNELYTTLKKIFNSSNCIVQE